MSVHSLEELLATRVTTENWQDRVHRLSKDVGLLVLPTPQELRDIASRMEKLSRFLFLEAAKQDEGGVE